jgi:hypothetical protein
VGRDVRGWIAVGYTLVEDAVYVGLGLLLAFIVFGLLAVSFASLARSLSSGSLPSIRRVLVLTAELGARRQVPQAFVYELAVLAALIVSLTGSLLLVGKKRN